jgi:hypothetical protein
MGPTPTSVAFTGHSMSDVRDPWNVARDAYLFAWLGGAVVAATGHVVFSRQEAARSRWGWSPGWQREVGIFNVVIAYVLLWTLRYGDDNVKAALTRAGIAFSAMTSGAHAHALVTESRGRAALHRGALGLNLAGLVTAAAVTRASDASHRPISRRESARPN